MIGTTTTSINVKKSPENSESGTLPNSICQLKTLVLYDKYMIIISLLYCYFLKPYDPYSALSR